MTHVGIGHSGDIVGVKISPDGNHIVSVSADGAILRWKYPTTNLYTTDPSPQQVDIQGRSFEEQEMEMGGASPDGGKEMGGVSPEREEEMGGISPKQEE